MRTRRVCTCLAQKWPSCSSTRKTSFGWSPQKGCKERGSRCRDRTSGSWYTPLLCTLSIGLGAHRIQVLLLRPRGGFFVNTFSLQLVESECGARNCRGLPTMVSFFFQYFSFQRCFRFTSKLSGKCRVPSDTGLLDPLSYTTFAIMTPYWHLIITTHSTWLRPGMHFLQVLRTVQGCCVSLYAQREFCCLQNSVLCLLFPSPLILENASLRDFLSSRTLLRITQYRAFSCWLVNICVRGCAVSFQSLIYVWMFLYYLDGSFVYPATHTGCLQVWAILSNWCP